MFRAALNKAITNKRLVAPAEFLLNMAMVYGGWRVFKYLSEHNANFLWGGWAWFQDLVGRSLAVVTAAILRLAGYELMQYERVIIIEGTRGIRIADLCLGIAPMVIFTGFILAYGNNRRAKLWFIPMGLVVIYMTNVARLLALTLVQAHYNKFFDMAHDYVYVTLTYGFIFVMVMWWMNKLAYKPSAA